MSECSCFLISNRHFPLLLDERLFMGFFLGVFPFLPLSCSAYNNLTMCLEISAGACKCYYPNAVVQDLFVKVHKDYFSSCGIKEDALPDAPSGVVLILTLLPVSIIPILVYMVIWKSSVSDWATPIRSTFHSHFTLLIIGKTLPYFRHIFVYNRMYYCIVLCNTLLYYNNCSIR